MCVYMCVWSCTKFETISLSIASTNMCVFSKLCVFVPSDGVKNDCEWNFLLFYRQITIFFLGGAVAVNNTLIKVKRTLLSEQPISDNLQKSLFTCVVLCQLRISVFVRNFQKSQSGQLNFAFKNSVECLNEYIDSWFVVCVKLTRARVEIGIGCYREDRSPERKYLLVVPITIATASLIM